uniref:Uncharacterized protein n=1 Tax=Arundo donax TaxID=35708 RepID=A0A0A8YGB8_ARUDO
MVVTERLLVVFEISPYFHFSIGPSYVQSTHIIIY